MEGGRRRASWLGGVEFGLAVRDTGVRGGVNVSPGTASEIVPTTRNWIRVGGDGRGRQRGVIDDRSMAAAFLHAPMHRCVDPTPPPHPSSRARVVSSCGIVQREAIDGDAADAAAARIWSDRPHASEWGWAGAGGLPIVVVRHRIALLPPSHRIALDTVPWLLRSKECQRRASKPAARPNNQTGCVPAQHMTIIPNDSSHMSVKCIRP